MHCDLLILISLLKLMILTLLPHAIILNLALIVQSDS